MKEGLSTSRHLPHIKHQFMTAATCSAVLNVSYNLFLRLAPTPLSQLLVLQVFLWVIGEIELGEDRVYLTSATSVRSRLLIHDPASLQAGRERARPLAR
jgi:hypothetical protein